MVPVANKNILLIVLATALLATSFAGCLTEDAPSQDDTTDSDQDGGSQDTNETSDGDDGGNTTANTTGTGPTANLTAAIDNATAPANVTFTLEGTDPDGDALDWTLDWDGDGTIDENGTTLPATIDVTYDDAGNYTARLVVTDKDGSANATVDLQIVAPLDDDDGLCHRPDATAVGPLWIDDRTGGEPGLDHWIYLESNDIPGLQVGGVDEADEYKGCPDPDTLIF